MEKYARYLTILCAVGTFFGCSDAIDTAYSPSAGSSTGSNEASVDYYALSLEELLNIKVSYTAASYRQ